MTLEPEKQSKKKKTPTKTTKPTTTKKPTKPTGTTTLKPITGHPFHGIFVFNGNNSATLANNPNIAGTYLGYAWAQLEPTQGQYNWTQIDNDMQPWLANNKKIILRVSPSGWTGWFPDIKSWTPSWALNGVQSVTESDNAIKPAYWNTAFLANYSAFIDAFGARYDGNANIICVEMGIGDGGETKPDTKNNPQRLQMWQKIGYSDAVWWDTIQKIAGFYQGAFKTTPLAMMPNASFIGGTKGYDEAKVTDWAIAQTPPIWLQNNGIIAGQPINQSWLKTTILGEQRLVTSQSGDTLDEDLALMINWGASYALCFEADLANSKNQATLAKFAALVK